MDARDAFNRAWGRFVNRNHSTQPLLIFLLVIALASLFIPTLNTDIRERKQDSIEWEADAALNFHTKPTP